MKKQKGVSLSGLMFWGVIVAMIALVVIKVAPSAIEYWKIRKGVMNVAQQAKGDSTVPELRKAYARQAEIDHTSDIKPEDLEISKEGNQIVISFAYDKRIPLFGPVSLLIEYKASSAGQ
ncbi:MAG: DUF4845 domain-containing protein [Rhodocyclaceae bacterium]|nr:DUF4845 domain-containing protein [Rhodocyclaceae bacterium]